MPPQTSPDLDYKIAFIDIETAPNVGYTWEKWETNVIAFKKEWYMLSFSVKWAHDKKVLTYALPDFKDYEKDPENDFALIKTLWAVLDQADLVLAHNGDKFDLRKANARFLYYGMTPPSPYKTIDTLKIARKYFALNSNKLDDICKFLGIGTKEKTGGFDLWLNCMSGDPKAWALMKKYNAKDVVLLEAVYNKLRPWHVSHPNIAIKDSTHLRCPTCSSTKLQKRGYNYLSAYKVQRYVCTACGKWSKGKSEKLFGEHLK